MLSMLGRGFQLIGLTGAIILVLVWYDQPERGNLRMLFFGTPGDAILIQTPKGTYVLIDGGNDGARLAHLVGTALPWWCRTLEAVVLTRPDMARLPGQVALLTRYRVRQVLAPAAPPPTPLETAEVMAYWNEWRQLLTTVPVYHFDHAGAGPVHFDLGGAWGTLWPRGPEQGPVIQVEYGNSRVVLNGGGGDMPFLPSPPTSPPLHLLAYPWDVPLPIRMLEREQPRALVFLSGQRHDPPLLLTYHERAYRGAAVFHPALNGTVEFVSDGKNAWITSQYP